MTLPKWDQQLLWAIPVEMGFSMIANVKGTIEERRLLLSPGCLLAGSDALYLQFKPIKCCQMLDKEYGKGFSILWQNISKQNFWQWKCHEQLPIDFSILLVFCNACFSIAFNFWQLNLSSTVNHSTNNQVSGKMEGDHKYSIVYNDECWIAFSL